MPSARTKRFSRFRSIRTRLTALFVAIFGTTLVAYCSLLYYSFRNTHQAEFDATLFNHTVDVAQAIDFNLFGDLAVRPNLLTESEKVFPFSLGNAFLQIRRPDGTLIARSRALGNGELPYTAADREILLQRKAGLRTIRLKGANYRLITYLIERPLVPRLLLQIAVPMTLIEKERQALLFFFLTSIPLVLIIAALGGLYLSRHALAPLRGIIHKARDISANQLSERLPVPDVEDEFKQLAVTLNELLTRLQLAFESQERFIADASHQLKTPLAIIRGELDLMRSQKRSPEEMSDFLASASQEIDYLSTMVEDLLLLARVDAGIDSLSFQQLRGDELLMDIVARLEIYARRKNVNVKLNLRAEDEGANPFEFKGDPELLQCLIRNLLENAIKFAPEGSDIQVSAKDEPDSVVIEVADQGPGIPEELLPKVFERFYRAEGTRDKVSGVGLGLPIAKRIAEVHGGSLGVASQPGAGTTFEARIKKF